jgi:hypothetical protein
MHVHAAILCKRDTKQMLTQHSVLLTPLHHDDIPPETLESRLLELLTSYMCTHGQLVVVANWILRITKSSRWITAPESWQPFGSDYQ